MIHAIGRVDGKEDVGSRNSIPIPAILLWSV